MRESSENIASVLRARQEALTALDSDFEDTMSRAELHFDDGLTRDDRQISKKFFQQIHESDVYPCDVCHRMFFHDHALQAHKLLHSGRKERKATKAKVQCGTCNKLFSNKWKLRFHQARHFNEKNTKILLVL